MSDNCCTVVIVRPAVTRVGVNDRTGRVSVQRPRGTVTVSRTDQRPVIRRTTERVAIREGLPGPAGPPGTAASIRETPIGALDGLNTIFTTSASFSPGTTVLYLNGLAQSVPEDYVEASPTTVVLTDPPLPGDRLLIHYSEV